MAADCCEAWDRSDHPPASLPEFEPYSLRRAKNLLLSFWRWNLLNSAKSMLSARHNPNSAAFSGSESTSRLTDSLGTNPVLRFVRNPPNFPDIL
jgi:hypothetical protein